MSGYNSEVGQCKKGDLHTLHSVNYHLSIHKSIVNREIDVKQNRPRTEHGNELQIYV